MPLFDSFVLSIVILSIAAAFYILLSDTPLEIQTKEEQQASWLNAFRERASHSAGARIAVATMVAGVFGVLEYLSHRIVLSLGMSPDVQAVWDGAVVAIAAASLSWLLLVGHAPAAQESASKGPVSEQVHAQSLPRTSFKTP